MWVEASVKGKRRGRRERGGERGVSRRGRKGRGRGERKGKAEWKGAKGEEIIKTKGLNGTKRKVS